MRLTVLGSGNGACAMAVDQALAGHEVVIADLAAFGERIEKISAHGGIDLSGGQREGFAKLGATTEVEDAIRFADMVVLAVPSYGHAAFFEIVARAIRDVQAFVIMAGRMGALEFAQLTAVKGGKGCLLGELDTLPYGCRLTSPTSVRFAVTVRELCGAAFPAVRTPELLEVIRPLYKVTYPARDVVETGLREIGMVTHPIEVLLGPLAREPLLALDDERRRVGAALGLQLPTAEAAMTGMGYRSWWRRADQPGPDRTDFLPRYLQEDIPYGCVSLSSLGTELDVQTSVCDAVVTLGSVIAGVDYRSTGRDARRLGLDGLTTSEMLRYLETGDRPQASRPASPISCNGS